MLTKFQRLFGVRRGERSRTLLLSAFLFLVISTYVAGKAARDALFLEQYSAVDLPYADIAVAVLVGLLVGIYMRARRRMEIATVVAGSLLFFAFNALALWWLGRSGASPAFLPVVVYVWVGMIGVVGPAQVWAVANHVFTLREAKRLFGTISSGAILGWIAGGLMTSGMARRFGTNEVLLAISIALALCALIVVVLWRQRPAALVEFDVPAAGAEENRPGSIAESLSVVCRSPYLAAVAVLIGLASLVTGIAGWQFKAIAKDSIPATDQLAAFFGSFNFYAGVLALVTQVAVTPRVLRRFGLGVALFVVPAALALGSLGVLAWGTLAAVVALKGSDQVLRYSIDKSTVELLFLPVPSDRRFQAKLLIDGIVWRAGDAIASAVILVAAGVAGVSAAGMGWVNLLFLGAWGAAAYVVYRQYVANLADSVHRHRLDVERASAPFIDRSMNELIASKLSAPDPDDVLYGMSLLEVSQERRTHPVVRTLLQHRSPLVRARAIGILSDARDLSVITIVERMLGDEDIRVRTEALLYLAHHDSRIDPLSRIDEIGDFADFSIRSAMVSFLARKGPAQNVETASLILDNMVSEEGEGSGRTRTEAARLIATLPNHFERQLGRLLHDPDPDVVKQAVKTVGQICGRRFLDRVIHLLGDPAFATECTGALVDCGDRVVGTLRDHLMDEHVPVRMRRGIPAILGAIGTPAAFQALGENVITADALLRAGVIEALERVLARNPGYAIDAEVVETALVAEVMGHYRSYEILATLGGPADEGDQVTKGLRESMRQELERIFKLLHLRFPDQDMASAYAGIRSANPVIHDKALELLDNVLRPQLRALLLPLCDSEVSVTERMELAKRLLGTNLGSREEAVSALIYSEDPWLEASAAYSIGALGLKSLERELDRWLDHPDLLLRETARHSKAQLAQLAAKAREGRVNGAAEGAGRRGGGMDGQVLTIGGSGGSGGISSECPPASRRADG